MHVSRKSSKVHSVFACQQVLIVRMKIRVRILVGKRTDHLIAYVYVMAKKKHLT